MGRLRINISGLMIVVFVLAVACASLRSNSGLGVNLVFCIALGLNFAALPVVALDLDKRIRISALAYAIGGWGWLALEAFVPWTDLVVRDYLMTPRIVNWIAPNPNGTAIVPNPILPLVLLLTHSLLSIASGTAGALAAWTFSSRFLDPDRSTTPTTGPS